METIDVSTFCKTKSEANDFMKRLAIISEKIYETNFQLDKVALELFGIQKKDRFLLLLRDNNVPSESASLLKEFLTKLQDTIAKLPVLSLTIAFEPKEETLQAFSEWFLINTKKQVLFNVVVDPCLIAGATISFNGKHGNFSIKESFDRIVGNVLTPKEPPLAQTTPLIQQQPAEELHLGR
jgi:F0F1-type ATP synthase delta subunit